MSFEEEITAGPIRQGQAHFAQSFQLALTNRPLACDKSLPWTNPEKELKMSSVFEGKNGRVIIEVRFKFIGKTIPRGFLEFAKIFESFFDFFSTFLKGFIKIRFLLVKFYLNFVL